MTPDVKDSYEHTKAKLVHQIARMGAARATIRTARQSLIDKAREQLDSMADAIHAAEQSVAADTADILGQRRLRALLTERSRLERLIGAYENRKRDAEASREPNDAP